MTNIQVSAHNQYFCNADRSTIEQAIYNAIAALGAAAFDEDESLSEEGHNVAHNAIIPALRKLGWGQASVFEQENEKDLQLAADATTFDVIRYDRQA